MADRSISEHAAYLTITNPDSTQKQAEKTKYIKNIQGRKYHIVATNASQPGFKLVVSTWVRGENDVVPITWQLVTAPFKLIWWLLKLILRTLSVRV